ncbi:MAG: ATP-binding protein [Candidatus Komeilibacteria bacterium]|nr:ATP-binding protein [Candidatus Komeilibacteria bacterium]
MIINRYLNDNILADLNQKMVFIGGPRQVGKTTLAKNLGQKNYAGFTYLNWDNREHRQLIIGNTLPLNEPLIVFDEIHKFKRWKNYLKGLYDVHKERLKILVTGSSRLDIYRRGGDSLLGRYHYYRLHPFSVAEAINKKPLTISEFKELTFLSTAEVKEAFAALWEFGGFPEPFLSQNATIARRFYRERLDRLVKEDIRDLEKIHDLSALQILAELLPAKVGSLFSASSLREDLRVTHKTVTSWLDILEKFYYHFRILPFHQQAIKSLRKQPKLYLWDWSELPNEAAKLENMVASHLLKFVHYLADSQGYQAELWFIRDTAGREVDFLVTIKKQPWFAVEVKSQTMEVSPNLIYFKEKMKLAQVYQIVKTSGVDQLKSGVRVMSADKFLSSLV